MQTHEEVSVETTGGRPTSTGRPTLAHVPGLDGLRGLAVAIVVAYHLDLLPGGFLGVDVFFVLSGYLITSLLLAEVARHGRVDARRFWGRRVRRLVPAVLVMVPTVLALAWAVRWPRTRLESLAIDAFATLTWWANWRQASGTSYWDADAPSLMRHAWSLAIEEQFYLVWPLVLIGVAFLARKLGRSLPASIGAAAALVFVASAAWHVILAHRVEATELSRVYVGTDTRVLAPLAGCVLACIWARRSSSERSSRSVAWGLGAAAALAIMAAMVVTVRVSSPELYRQGGFVVVALASMLIVAATLTGATRVTGWASWAPLRYLGVRSYGIYLWSWPLQVLAEHRFPEMPRGWMVLGVVVTSLVVAEISFQLVEDPIRRGRWWAARPLARRPAWGAAVAIAATAVVVTSSLAVEPPVHEQIDTAESATMATHHPPPSTSPDQGGDGTGADEELRVMLIGDSVIWTVGYHLPAEQRPDGIASIDGRAVIGCGLLAADGWLYRSTDPNQPEFVEPAGGACVDQAEAERIGLTGDPDVVLVWPGAWEERDVQSPDGEVLRVSEPEFREQMVDTLVDKALAAHEVGAAFGVISWACPGDDAPPERRSAEHLHRMEEISTAAIDIARDDHGVEAFVIPPNEEVCVEADPFGEPTPEKDRAMNHEVHVKDSEGATWVWHHWLGPALRERLVDRD